MSIRVAIADDHPLARQGLRQFLQGEEDMEVVAEADSGNGLLAALGERDPPPDVVLVDARMPSLDGIEATREIHERFGSTRVIVLSAFDDPDLVLRAIAAGACAYLLKSCDGSHIARVIRLVAEGDVVIDHAIAEEVLQALPDHIPNDPRPGRLTDPEIEVLRLLSVGRTNKQIARELHISPETVKGRVARLTHKLGATDRTAAVAEGFRRKAIE